MKTDTTRKISQPTSPKSANKAASKPKPSSRAVAPNTRTRPKPSKLPVSPAPVPQIPTSKKQAIETMLRAPAGSAMAALVAATGWQAHSVRAALTGFRKAGCTIERDRDESGTRYRIVATV